MSKSTPSANQTTAFRRPRTLPRASAVAASVAQRVLGVPHLLEFDRLVPTRELLAGKLFDRGEQTRLAAGEVLHRGGAPACHYDRHQIVHADEAFDELRGRAPHVMRPPEVGLQIVEDDQDDASVELADVRAHVGLDDGAAKERRIGARNRQIDHGEGADRLRLPLFNQFEIVLRQTTDEVPLRIDHRRVDFDVIDFHTEGRRLPGRRLLRRKGGHTHDQRNRNCCVSHASHPAPLHRAPRTAHRVYNLNNLTKSFVVSTSSYTR